MTNSRLEIDLFGNKRWRNSIGDVHQENGPAVIYTNGDTFWCINNQSHRVDGPASYMSEKFYMSWWLNDTFIRKFEYD